MPFEIKKTTKNVQRCFICKKLITNPYSTVKTCCVNKPIVFCSKTCMKIWERTWLKKQEQIGKTSKNIGL